MTKKLTDKQERYIIEYPIDLNATQAAIRSGYSEKTARQAGYDLMTKPYILEAIQKQMNKISDVALITAKEVVENIKRIGSSAEEDKQHSAALKAQELLGKHIVMFTDKIEHSGEIKTIQTLSDDQLTKMVKDLGGKA